uniref:F-box domain-containing protein n=1 Tax=Strongyloides papillosus TaxID=174720 RepID=A0A0N5CDD3_STREA
MGKKRSYCSEHSRSSSKIPCKEMKLNDENESIPEEKVENEEASISLTAAEKIGRNMNLMNLIVRNIDSVKERRNIAQSCKAFNILCNSKKSYVESYKHRMEDHYDLKFPKSKPLYILFDEVLVINISRYRRRRTRKLEMVRNEIMMNKYKIKALKIRNLPAEYFNFFKELDCFENVNTVYFDVLDPEHVPLGIFSEWKGLKPDTLIFGESKIYHFGHEDLDRALHSSESYTFPESIKHVHLICEGENIDWMVNALRNFNHYELESLVLGSKFTKHLTTDTMKSLVPVVRYFKEVQFSVNCRRPLPLNKYFSQTLDDFNAVRDFDTVVSIHFNVTKCDAEVWASDDPPMAENNNTLSYNLYENVSLKERYRHMKSVRIKAPTHPFLDLGLPQMRVITKKLSEMKNLLTFEMQYEAMACCYFRVSKLFCALNRNLKNVRFYYCDVYLTEYDLVTLSKYCPNIENICLEDIDRRGITIKLITSLFKNLKGLELEFICHRSIKDVINDLIKRDEINGNHLLNWPNLNFLSVYFSPPKAIQKELLDAMDKNTPRKSGQFLIRRNIRFYSRNVWQIIIQKNMSCASTFNNIFHDPYIF